MALPDGLDFSLREQVQELRHLCEGHAKAFFKVV
jgi:hypothetical protein